MQCTLKGKRLLLWQEINEEVGFPDRDIVSDIRNGFPMTGWLPQGGLFKVRVPEFDVVTLKALAKGLNETTLERLSYRQPEEVEAETWQETEKEI